MITIHPIHLGIIIWGAFALYKRGYDEGYKYGALEEQVYSRVEAAKQQEKEGE